MPSRPAGIATASAPSPTFCVVVASTALASTPGPDRHATPLRDSCSAGVAISDVRETLQPLSARATTSCTNIGAALGLAPGDSAAGETVDEPEKPSSELDDTVALAVADCRLAVAVDVCDALAPVDSDAVAS